MFSFAVFQSHSLLQSQFMYAKTIVIPSNTMGYIGLILGIQACIALQLLVLLSNSCLGAELIEM
jgi:hypothetical protein